MYPFNMFIELFAALLALEVKLGALLPLSGPYAPVGADNQRGIELAKEEVDFDVIYADSKAEPAQAILEFQKLVSINNVEGVFVFRGPPGMAVNPISKKEKIPLLGGVGNKDFVNQNEYAFQAWIPSDKEGAFMARQMNNYEKIALITVQDDWPISVSKGFRESIGKKLVFDEEILPSQTDIRSQAHKLKNIDAIFLNVGISQIGSFTTQLKSLGVKSRIFSNFWAGKEEVISTLGDEELSFAEMDSQDLTSAELSAYVAAILFAKAPSYEALINQKEVVTKRGTYKINNQVIEFPMRLRTIKNGKVY